jgi:hypothetical protein
MLEPCWECFCQAKVMLDRGVIGASLHLRLPLYNGYIGGRLYNVLQMTYWVGSIYIYSHVQGEESGGLYKINININMMTKLVERLEACTLAL